MNVSAKLKELKEQKGMTNEEISEVSGIPENTVAKIISGSTQDPRLESVIRIVIALGGSLDVITGIATPDEAIPSRVEQTMTNYAELLREKDERIRDKDRALRTARRDRTILLVAFICVLLAIIGVLLFDLLNGHVGFVRY